MLKMSVSELENTITLYILLVNICIFALGISFIAINNIKINSKLSIRILSVTIISNILSFIYIEHKKDEIEVYITKSFHNSKDLICRNDNNERVIVSKENKYISKSIYFIRDETIIDMDSCKLLDSHNDEDE